METKDVGKRLFKTINNEIIFGNTELIETERGTEIIIKKPYTAIAGDIMPYMVIELMKAPAAIQLHPMNIIWSVELDEFKEVHDAYLRATSGLIL